MTSSPSLTTAPLPLSGQSGIGWSIRRPSPGRPGDGRHDQLGNFQTALLGRITPASTSLVPNPRDHLPDRFGHQLWLILVDVMAAVFGYEEARIRDERRQVLVRRTQDRFQCIGREP